MNITHVRNATLIIEYANKTILIDPMLGEKVHFRHFQMHQEMIKIIH